MIQAHLEITSGIIRLYSQGSFIEKSPFDMALTMVADGDHATLKALQTSRGFSREQRQAINDCLKGHGFSIAVWERFKRIDRHLALVRHEVGIR